MQDREWSWVGEDGIEYQGAQHQLESELSSERIPAYTLVSRLDWRDWLPAMQVAELQWALPPVLADSPRQPTSRSHGPKLPPPLDQYPSLRDRAVQLLRRSAPRAELPSRPAPSAPPSFAPAYNLSQYGEDDFDEPTVQIDAEQLERALNQSRGDEDYASQPGQSSRPPSPRTGQDTSLLHRMPTFPGHLPGHPGSQAPPPIPPHIAQPNTASGHPLQARPGNPPNAFGGHEPTLASRVESQVSSSDGRQFRRGRGKAFALVAFAACAGLFAAWLLGPEREAPVVTARPPNSATVTAPQAPPDEPKALQCSAEKHLQLSDFAHVQVPPMTRHAESNRIAVGFAQTSRLAIGLAVDPASLSVERVFTESQSSPLWSVVPVPMGDLEFRTNRAASTLRSTTTIPTQPPLAFGLSRDGLAVRGPDDAVDRLLWKTDWDTTTVPEVQLLNGGSYAVAVRAGGERGQILLGKVSASGSPEGDLLQLTGLDDGRLDVPSLFASDRHVYVSVAAGTGAHKDRLYIAMSTEPDLPNRVRKVLTVEEGITSPRLASVGDGKLLLQYTTGATGHQRVLGLPLDAKLNPMGLAFEISPPGRDAYEGTVANHDGTLLSLFFARHEHGHELWLARLRCAPSPAPNEPKSSN